MSVEELPEDIGRRGLLQSLNVRAVLDESGAETGTCAVTAGGRRRAALQRLVRAKQLAKTAPVPCIVKGDGAAEEDSLAENTMRKALHPLDQFRAFQSLRDEHGMGDEEIAARFFVTPAVVRQRLKLASVSPKLLDFYAADVMSLEQLMGFTIAGDHARQEAVWETLSRGNNREPYQIRRMLTEGAVKATDKRAMFVGLDAYEAAGGIIERDLFQAGGGGYLKDVGRLERLVREKLDRSADEIRAQGWLWVEATSLILFSFWVFGMCGGVGWLGLRRMRRCSAGRARWRPSRRPGLLGARSRRRTQHRCSGLAGCGRSRGFGVKTCWRACRQAPEARSQTVGIANATRWSAPAAPRGAPLPVPEVVCAG